MSEIIKNNTGIRESPTLQDYIEGWEGDDSFRDSIATVDKKGKRIWLFPKKPEGRYYNTRNLISLVFLIILFSLPFIKVNGEPFFLFNILTRNFIIFGIHFTPQDFYLFGLAMVTFVVFIVLFTVVFGRLFCGWVCPQTVFMEMVFRKIEYWIEGDWTAQQRLDKAPWTGDKILKRLSKHAIFFVIAVVISNLFLSYIIGVTEVSHIMKEPVGKHLGGFAAMLIFSGIFYFVFAYLREQVCIAICPYGRLQSVLLDKDSIVVAYDFKRGEPRGKLKKQKTDEAGSDQLLQKPKGDCIDCKLCVHVCPTGIDIRNGTQLECVNCTACIDACDAVMVKINKPRGLVRYASFNAINAGIKNKLSKRVLAYSLVLVALLGIQAFLWSNRVEVDMIVLRTPGVMFTETSDDYISNLYNYTIINKSGKPVQDISLKINGNRGRIKLVGALQNIDKSQTTQGAFFIEIKEDALKSHKETIRIELFSGATLLDKTSTTFMGPVVAPEED